MTNVIQDRVRLIYVLIQDGFEINIRVLIKSVIKKDCIHQGYIDSKDDDVYLDLGDEGLGLDINDVTSPSIDSATTPNATTAASQNLQFKEELEYDHVGRLRIIPYHDGVKECRRIIKGVDKDGDGFVNFEEFKQMMAAASFSTGFKLGYQCFKSKQVPQISIILLFPSFIFDALCSESNFLNGGVDVPIPKTFKETHKKKNSDGFQKSIEDWRQTQTASEDGTMVQPSPADMNRIWTNVVGGRKKGKTYGLGGNQSLSSSSPMLATPLLFREMWKKWKR
ncbi:putative calcium-binding protein CML15 [Capsicum chinense]|nr:putative calcium-binding protein CML15 [Capsicum chinense]